METKKPNNPRMQQFDGIYASDAYKECDVFTLRDYFANSAMQAYITDHLQYKRENKNGWTVKDMADSAYVIADAMLKQREL